MTWLGSDGAESISASVATPNLLTMLGVDFHIGRAVGAGDGTGQPVSAVLTYTAWQRRFGSDATVIDRTIAFRERAVQIVGVLLPC